MCSTFAEPTSAMKLPRPQLLWCILWLLFISVAYSDAGSGMGIFLLCYGITIGWGLAWLIRLIVYAWKTRRGVAIEHRGFAYWSIEPLTFMIAMGIAVSGASAYLRFIASQSALARYVKSVTVSSPDSTRWVGLYAVRETEVLPDGVVRFITSESGFDDAGFAFAPRSSPPIVGEDSYSNLPFAEGWYHWHRSW
jgi:hypothetical protein